jgi:hypothetical protein
MDNVQIFNLSLSTIGQAYFLFGMVNVCCTTVDISNWYDGLVDSTQRIYPASTIEISNSATYGSGTKVYQEPVYLSDGSVRIKANLSGLGGGPYYLWVTNNGQVRSAPYPLSGVAAPAAPQPPTLISVQ